MIEIINDVKEKTKEKKWVDSETKRGKERTKKLI